MDEIQSLIHGFGVALTLKNLALMFIGVLLGVIIGVASLVAVLSIGDGLERFTREQLETTPIQTIEVAPRTSVTVDGVRVPGTVYPTFTTRHAESLTREVGGIAEARLVLTGSARFMTRGSERAALVMGLSQERAAGVSGRADPGNRHSQGDRRTPPRYPGTVSG